LKEYQFNRIVGLIAPDKLDRLLEGWNREQSLIAIGSGGFEGKGWTKGNVTHGGYLPRPVAPSDFIYAVFAEETGFLGSCVLILLYTTILFGGLRITMKAHDRLGMLIAAGATFLIFSHVFMNMGMTLGILPIVGVPLPLMSYGGSFVIVCMIALGLLQSVWIHRNPY
jgi:rod shape determining protein RodA